MSLEWQKLESNLKCLITGGRVVKLMDSYWTKTMWPFKMFILKIIKNCGNNSQDIRAEYKITEYKITC